MDASLADVFLANVVEPERFGADPVALALRLRELDEVARAAWPELALEPEHFIAYLAARVAVGVPAREALAIHAGDLLLAHRCAEGDAKALAAIEARDLAHAPKFLAKYGLTAARLADVLQIVRERLFVGAHAKIKEYTGRGPLGGWLRTTVVNTAINLGLHEDRLRPWSTEGFEELLFTETDPDLALFRERYGAAFRLAFQDGLNALLAEEANLLRSSVVDGKSIDEIAATWGIHRATAARRIAACRTKLYEATRDALAEHVPGSATELHSMMGALKSIVESSLKRFLKP
jgi:RNA polymerase sigma-70 factor, ECF subfamily